MRLEPANGHLFGKALDELVHNRLFSIFKAKPFGNNQRDYGLMG
jgi:hypothetical protein